MVGDRRTNFCDGIGFNLLADQYNRGSLEMPPGFFGRVVGRD